MEITVSKNDLENALLVCSNTVGSGGADISTHFVFRNTGNAVEVLSYSGRLFSSSPIKACTATGEQTAFTVEAKRLKLWLSSVSDCALTLSFDAATTKAKANKGTQTFRSLDPTHFPYWDDVVEEATETAKISADTLSHAFSHVRKFISTDDTKRPAFCVTEAREGLLLAASTGVFSVVEIEDFPPENTLRVNGKNVNSLVSYLNLFEDNEIVVLEHSNFILYKGIDGSMLGEARDNHSFPKIKIGMEDPTDHQWVMDTKELRNAMLFLRSGAPFEDVKLTFRTKDTDNVSLGMAVAGPDGGHTFLDLETTQTTTQEEGVGEFVLNYKHLEMILSTIKEDKVEIGITKKNQSGLCRLDASDGTNNYVSMLSWMK